MIYLSTFRLSDKTVNVPHLYPYHLTRNIDFDCFVFDKVTILYGNNGSGKSSFLNIIAQALNIAGAEAVHYTNQYFLRFVQECSYGFGEDDDGKPVYRIPENSRYIKSEDILYEIKKIQQSSILMESELHNYVKEGKGGATVSSLMDSWQFNKRMADIVFGQEKYSNGETSMHIYEEAVGTDALFLLDEPEVSLSPANQILMAEMINKHARFLGCQFIIATHSPFMLGTLEGKIYNLDTEDFRVSNWKELDNVKCYFDFFRKHSE